MFTRIAGLFNAGPIQRLAARIISAPQSLPDIHDQIVDLINLRRSDLIPVAKPKSWPLFYYYFYYASVTNYYYLKEYGTQRLAQGNPWETNELQQLLDQHNKCFPNEPSKAGSIAFEIDRYKIYYNEKGYLFLAAPDRKAVEPIASNGPTSDAQIHHIEIVHQQLANVPYNNMGVVLEFMRFLRECRTTNPSLTFREAFLAFQPNSRALFEKYRSGCCVVLAGAMREQMKNEGFKTMAVLGQQSDVQWSRVPPVIFDFNYEWPAFNEATENTQHCYIVFKYSDKKEQNAD